MALSPEEARRLSAVEEKCRDLDSAMRRLKSEIELSVNEINKAAILHMERIMSEGLVNIAKDVAEIKRSQETSLGLMRDAAEERGRRIEREAEDKRRTEERAQAFRERAASVDLEIRVDAADVDVEKARADTAIRKWKAKAVVFGIVVTTAVSLITALVASYRGAPAPSAPPPAPTETRH